MPRLADRLPENAPGDLYVDRSCIDCGTCRRLAPDVFAQGDGVAYVARQPKDTPGHLRAYMALLACPVGAIGAAPRADLRPARDSFPEEVLPDVLACGYASERAVGAAAWLVRRPEGNVLVDVPRFARPLVERIAELGGVRYIFLTRGAHAGEAEAWTKRFNAERVGHRAELEGRVERTFDADFALAEDLRVLCVPGQSAGCAALLFREEVLFSGDHVYGDGNGALLADVRTCHHSWTTQRASVEALLAARFGHVLPGHGHAWHGGHAAAAEALTRLLTEMRGTAELAPEARRVIGTRKYPPVVETPPKTTSKSRRAAPASGRAAPNEPAATRSSRAPGGGKPKEGAAKSNARTATDATSRATAPTTTKPPSETPGVRRRARADAKAEAPTGARGPVASAIPPEPGPLAAAKRPEPLGGSAGPPEAAPQPAAEGAAPKARRRLVPVE